MLTDASTQLQQANNTNTNTNVYGAVIMTKAIARVHPVHLMNADSDPSQLTYTESADRADNIHIHRRHLLLSHSPNADTHLTITCRVEV